MLTAWNYQLTGTAEQAVMMAGMYRFLVSDFLNPLQLATGGPGSAEVYVFFFQKIFLEFITKDRQIALYMLVPVVHNIDMQLTPV